MEKYTSIMNPSALTKKFQRRQPDQIKKILDLDCEITEKIHGENFRVGYNDKGFYIGQRSVGQTFYEGNFDKHPNYNKFSQKLREDIETIKKYLEQFYKSNEQEITFFGELHGYGVQDGFEWPFEDGLRVRFFDIRVGNQYFIPAMARYTIEEQLALDYVPVISENMKLQDALKLNVEELSSQVARNDYIEGVVIKPNNLLSDGTLDETLLWDFPSRLVIKSKTEKYSEQKRHKSKKIKKKVNDYVSPFVDFITDARVEHAHQSLAEQGIELNYEMSDLRHLTKEVIADIEREENEGNPLDKKDRKYLNSYIPRFYKSFLNKKLNEIIENK